MTAPTATPAASRSRTAALAAVAVAAVLFGTSGVARELGPDGPTSSFVGSWRIVIGGAALALAATVGARRTGHHRTARATDDEPRGESRSVVAGMWTVAGGAATVGYQLAFFAAADRMGVGGAAVVTIGTGPVVAGVLDLLLNRRRPSARWAAGVAVSVAGIAALSSAGGSGGSALGWGLAVAAGCCYPLYGLATQRLMAERPPLTAIATVFGAGAVLALPIAVSSSPGSAATAPTIALVLYLGVAATGLAYGLWSIGLDRLTLSETVAVTLAEPAAAVALSALLLDEPLTAGRLAGMVVVLGGVAMATSRGAAPATG